MIENKFFRMLFDYRGTISRRQYWGSLLFLLILLSTNNIIHKWESLGTLFGISSRNSIQNYDIYLFLTYLSNVWMIVLYFSSFAIAVSIIVITLKRSRTLGYSKLSAWLFAIISYVAYFSLSALTNYYQYKSNSPNNYNEIGDNAGVNMVIPVSLAIIGLFMVATIIIVILLSRQVEIDYEEEPDYAYDSISCIFGLVKFSILYVIIAVCWKLSLPWMILQSPLLSKLLTLGLVIFYIYYYLQIFIKRSRDAKVNSIYIICAFFALIALIGLYIFTLAIYLSDGKPLLDFFFKHFCFILISIYVIGTYILIALPSKQIEDVES